MSETRKPTIRSRILALDRPAAFIPTARVSRQRRGARGRLDMRDRLVTCDHRITRSLPPRVHRLGMGQVARVWGIS